MRIAVTGAGGFIGSALVRRLAAGGANVRALLGAPGMSATLPPPEVTQLWASIDDLGAILELVEDTDLVFHLAGMPSVAASFADPVGAVHAHAGGTAAVVEACRRAGVQRLVYVSSAEVYGRPRRDPVDEEHPLEARSPYAAAKIAAERLVEASGLAYGLEAAVLRPFSVYGPGASPRGVFGTLIGQAAAGASLAVRDPGAVRDLCFVEDVVDALLAAAAGPAGVYNVGSGTGVSVGELVELVASVTRVMAAPAGTACPQGDRPVRADVPRLVADVSRARARLGWAAATPLLEGIRRTWEAIQRGRREAAWQTIGC